MIRLNSPRGNASGKECPRSLKFPHAREGFEDAGDLFDALGSALAEAGGEGGGVGTGSGEKLENGGELVGEAGRPRKGGRIDD